jgi:Autoinducer binding domain
MKIFDMDLQNEPKGAFASFDEATRYLEQACVRLNVHHLSYWLVSNVDGTPDQVTWIATYDPAYMSYYMTNYTPLGDPTFETSISDNTLLDWAAAIDDDVMTQKLMPIAMKYGITRYGVSIPLKDGKYGDVLFSVNMKSNDQEWPLLKEDLVAKLRPFAHYFHERAKQLIASRRISEIDFAA